MSKDQPPSYDSLNLPPYHNWAEAVPDTSTLPPPPISGYLLSGTGNASEIDADRAHEYCAQTPLWTPVLPSSAVWNQTNTHNLHPVLPHEFSGKFTTPAGSGSGKWKISSKDGSRDCVILSHLPLYFAAVDHPALRRGEQTQVPGKMIYFEVKCTGYRKGNGGDSGFSIGYAAQPYPSWRSPGWERGSLAVFSDDGCRFVNDSWGGRDFTTAVRPGETVGLGMIFREGLQGQYQYQYQQDSKDVKGVKGQTQSSPGKCKVEIFFTRNGRDAGGWDLHEEVDADSGGVEGLEGDFDVYGAVGLFGGVDFEVCFDPKGWLWKRST